MRRPGRRHGPSRKAREIVLKLALLAASTAVSLVVAEIVVARFFPQPTYAVRLSPWGFEHIPGIAFKHTTESRETVSYIRYNREGFRGGTEYAVAKRPETLRVAILGDSYAEGAEVDEPYLHSTVLEQRLDAELATERSVEHTPGRRYRRAEVINAGVYAYDSCQELRLFEARVLKYRPDVVVVIYTGELEDNRHFCRLTTDGLAYVDMPYTHAQYLARYAIGYARAKSHIVNYLGGVYRRYRGDLLLPPALTRRFDYRPPDHRELDAAAAAVTRPIDAYATLPPGARAARLPGDDDHRLLFAIFSKLDGLVRSYGGRLSVVFSHRPAADFALAHHADREGVGILDVFSYVNDRRTRPAHLELDGHWNEYGHRLVGHALFELIRARHLEAP